MAKKVSKAKKSSGKASKTSKKSTPKKATSKKVAKVATKKSAPKKAQKKKTSPEKSKKFKTEKAVTKSNVVKKKSSASKSTKKTTSATTAKQPKTEKVKAAPRETVASPPPAPKPLIKYGAPPFPIKKKPSFHPPVESPVNGDASEGKKITFDKKFLDKQRSKLLELRDHILDQMQGVAQDSLRSKSDTGAGSAFGMHQADAGSDAYEKDFALSLLSQEQDALYEIEEALKRIENETYGICEMSNQTIPTPRLEAIPFARFTVDCQAIIEKQNKGRHRWNTTPQFMDSTDNFYEEDNEEDAASKLKD